MPIEWFLEKVPSDEEASWYLHQITGNTGKCVARIEDEDFAKEILEIVKWRDALWIDSGIDMTLLDEPIDANTGKPWVRPADLKSYDIKFTSPRTRAKTKKPQR